MKITSVQNETIKKYALLKTKKHRDEAREFIIEGHHLVKEALKTNLVKKIFYTDLKDINCPYVECIEVNESVLAKLSSTNSPQGVIAIVSFFDYELNLSSYHKVIALDQVQDPGNAGTIVRSAKAFGYDAVLFSNNSVDIYNDKFIRSTQGYFFTIPFFSVNLTESLLRLKENGHTLIATHLSSNSKNPEQINSNTKLTLILGNEGNGVSDEVLNISDENVIIPMVKYVDSLNVGIAGSILMYLWRNK